jgi:acyl-CoA thioesterase
MTMSDFDLAKKCRDTMYAADVAVRSLDIEVAVTAVGAAEATLEVRPEMLNGHDVCHGGYLFTLADTAFAYACNSQNEITLASAASIEFLRPGKLGDRLQATAIERHRGGRTGVYDVRICNQDGAEIALFRGRSYSTRRSLVDSL